MPNSAWSRLDHLFFVGCNDAATARGFEAVSPRQWIRTRTPGIRDLIWIVKERGGIYSAHWGFSLDFVPLIRNERVTDKANKSLFVPDIVFDAYDCDANAFNNNDWTLLSVFPSSPQSTVSADVWEHKILPAADAVFRSVSSVNDLLPVFVRKRQTRVRFGWDLSVRLHLAYIFTLAQLGDRHAAMAAYLDWAGRPTECEIAIQKIRARLETIL